MDALGKQLEQSSSRAQINSVSVLFDANSLEPCLNLMHVVSLLGIVSTVWGMRFIFGY